MQHDRNQLSLSPGVKMYDLGSYSRYYGNGGMLPITYYGTLLSSSMHLRFNVAQRYLCRIKTLLPGKKSMFSKSHVPPPQITQYDEKHLKSVEFLTVCVLSVGCLGFEIDWFEVGEKYSKEKYITMKR